MSGRGEEVAIALFGELFMADQLARARIGKALPKGMELSHFAVLNHLARIGEERTPAQLARAFHVTRGAMTNTLNRLEWAGHVHIRPDWDDARRKFVAISPAGRAPCSPWRRCWPRRWPNWARIACAPHFRCCARCAAGSRMRADQRRRLAVT